MAESDSHPTREQFSRSVQDALGHLYDSPYLQGHPLAELLAEPGTDRVARGQQVRQALYRAIRAMHPGNGVPAQSPDWRAYRLLELRYIDGLGPTEVMQQLGLSRSHYFHEQSRLLDALAATLWEQWRASHPPNNHASSEDRAQLAGEEIERLSAQAHWETVDLNQVLLALRPIVDSVARAKHATVLYESAPAMVPRADRVLLRQALINTATFALDAAKDGQCAIASYATEYEVGVRISSTGTTIEQNAPYQQNIGLETSRKLMAAMGGTMLVTSTNNALQIVLGWPATATPVLLVVDDNAGIIELFRRYLAGRDWQILGASDGVEARQILAERHVTLVTLDVMMPREDGWELLVELRANERTQHIPVIVCSVLHEPQIALSLGATAYLPKPVSQQALLQALGQWSG